MVLQTSTSSVVCAGAAVACCALPAHSAGVHAGLCAARRAAGTRRQGSPAEVGSRRDAARGNCDGIHDVLDEREASLMPRLDNPNVGEWVAEAERGERSLGKLRVRACTRAFGEHRRT